MARQAGRKGKKESSSHALPPLLSSKLKWGVETLTELAMHSPVYEMLSKAVPVEFTLLTSQEADVS